MSERTIDTELLRYFHSLPKPEQLNVLNYLKSLIKKGPRKDQGLADLAGSIPEKDLKKISDTIREGCEQIDENEW